MSELSVRQQKLLGFIRRFLGKQGYPPTIRDLQAGCDISSTSVVDYNLNILEKGGYIRRHAEVSRGIELVGGFSLSASLVTVPLIGQIAAGEPIPVPDNDSWDATAGAETLELTRDLTQGKNNIFALRVKGNSMIDALINDGDTVLMQVANTVENGEMAAVWFREEKETTLKKVYVEGDRVRLQPANREMQPIFTAPDNVAIQGKVIGVIRSYP